MRYPFKIKPHDYSFYRTQHMSPKRYHYSENPDVIVEEDDLGRIVNCSNFVTGYWCTVEYYDTGEWHKYRNSDGFEVTWTRDGKSSALWK